MADDFTLKGKVVLDTTGLAKPTEEVKGLTSEFTNLFGGLSSTTVAMAAVGAAAVGLAIGIKNLTDEAYEAYCEFDRLGYTIGVSASEMAKWNQVAIYSDSTGTSLATMLGKLSVNMSDAEMAGQKARQHLTDMGIASYDAEGNIRPLTELFPEIVGGLANIDNAAERNGRAMDLFGRGYKELSGYMILGQDGINEVLAESNSLTEKQQVDLGLLEERYKDLNRTMLESGMVLGAELAPAVEELINSINTLLDLDDGKFFKDMVSGIGMAVDAFTILVRGITLACIGIEYLQALTKGDFAGAAAIKEKGAQYVADYTAKDKEAAFDTLWDAAGGKSNRGKGGKSSISGNQLLPGQSGEGVNQYGGVGNASYGPTQQINLRSQGSSFDNLNPDGTVNYGASDGSGGGFSQSWAMGGAGDKYSQVEAIWAQAASERRSSPYIQAILELAKAKGQDISGGASSGADWKYSSGNESLANQTLAAWESYKNTPTINLTVYATGSDQQIANDTALAVSRTLAAQVRI